MNSLMSYLVYSFDALKRKLFLVRHGDINIFGGNNHKYKILFTIKRYLAEEFVFYS